MAKKKQSEEKGQEKKQSRYFWLAIIIIVLFIISLLSVRFFVPEKKEFQSYSYNGFVFQNISGMWFTEIQKAGTNKVYRVPLHYGPPELENVSISKDINNFFTNKTKIYITFNPLGKNFSYIALAASEISINLAQTFNITPIAACTINETKACVSRPLVTCENAGSPAISLKHANDTKVYLENNCVVVQGPGRELMRATDRLLLKWFSIMP